MITRDKSFYRTYFSLLLFVAAQNLLSYSVSLLDNVMLARYSSTALNGASLANQIQFLLQMVVTAAGEGVAVISSQYWGAKKLRPIYPVFTAGLLTALTLGFVFSASVSAFPGGILSLLARDTDIINAGCEYLDIIRFTYPVWCLTTVLLATQRSVENARIGFIVTLMSLFLNLLLNYCLIFGHLGFPELGIRGAAWATLAARLFELAVALIYSLKIDKKLRLTPKNAIKFDSALWKDYFRHATPIMLGGASWGIAMFIQTSIIGHMGGDVISANSLALSLFSVISVFAYGGGSAAGVITGKVVGSGDLSRLKEYVVTMQLLFLATGLVTGLTIFLVRGPVIHLYNLESPEAVRYAGQFVLVLSITSVGTSYQAPCLTGIVRGGGNTRFVFLNDLVFQWGVVLSFALMAAYWWKLPPVWVFFILKSDQLIKCTVAVFVVNRYRWIRVLTNKEKMNGQV
ncbi:MAG: MATE family efflux transporter [Clostridiales bacterium]|nr:MATE family efflux transporter [Clostridiales bacterium]